MRCCVGVCHRDTKTLSIPTEHNHTAYRWEFVPRALKCLHSAVSVEENYLICICNRMRPSRIKDKFSRVFSKFSQNCPSRVATRAICENFENTSENLSLILRGLNAITCL